jgi:hypothetical protein
MLLVTTEARFSGERRRLWKPVVPVVHCTGIVQLLACHLQLSRMNGRLWSTALHCTHCTASVRLAVGPLDEC